MLLSITGLYAIYTLRVITMSEYKQNLLREAANKYKKIYPCGESADLSECFTEYDDTLYLWFNTEDDSTHVIALNVKQAA